MAWHATCRVGSRSCRRGCWPRACSRSSSGFVAMLGSAAGLRHLPADPRGRVVPRDAGGGGYAELPARPPVASCLSVATYLDRILDAHRRRVRDDTRSVDRLRRGRRWFAAHTWLRRRHPRPRIAPRARLGGGHRRGQAAVAVEGRPLARPRSGRPGPPVRSGRRRVPVGAHRCRVLRWLTRRSAGGAGRGGPARAAQGLHRLGPRRRRRPVDGRRRGAADRRGVERQRAGATSMPSRSSSASTHWSRCTTRPSSNGRSAAGATLIGVNQRDLVTFEVDTDRAVRVSLGRSRPASSRSPSRASSGPRTRPRWPRPVTTPCSSVRRS